MTAAGNWDGVNVLHVPAPDEAEWRALAGARRTLLAARGRRVQPLRDDKVLAGWNGLMIEALALAGRVLDEPRWVEAAAGAAGFVLDHLVVGGRLRRGWLGGPSTTPAFLDDHAFLAAGLLELFAATAEPRWLTAAVTLAEAIERHFGDPERGGWFQGADDHERLLVREKPAHDGAEPAGSSVAVQALLRLAAYTGDDRWRDAAERALRCDGPALEASPMARAELLLGLELAHAPPPRGGAHLAGAGATPGRSSSRSCGGPTGPGWPWSAARPRRWPGPPARRRWPRRARRSTGGRPPSSASAAPAGSRSSTRRRWRSSWGTGPAAGTRAGRERPCRAFLPAPGSHPSYSAGSAARSRTGA